MAFFCSSRSGSGKERERLRAGSGHHASVSNAIGMSAEGQNDQFAGPKCSAVHTRSGFRHHKPYHPKRDPRDHREGQKRDFAAEAVTEVASE